MLRRRRKDDEGVRRAAQRAAAHVRAANPTFSVTNTVLRAAEAARYVFAVFYREAGTHTVPGKYRLVSVDRARDDVEELDTSPASPYWIRGRK